MTASLVLLRPVLSRAAVLFQAMVPFEPELMPNLAGTSVYLAAGQRDRMIVQSQAERLAKILREAGAEVELRLRDTATASPKKRSAKPKSGSPGESDMIEQQRFEHCLVRPLVVDEKES